MNGPPIADSVLNGPSSTMLRTARQPRKRAGLETHELFDQEQLSQMLARAKAAAGAYQPPGQQASRRLGYCRPRHPGSVGVRRPSQTTGRR
jgi:hypothetical protein